MAVNNIFVKIADDTVDVDVEQYAAFVRQELAECYPQAAITVETTMRESGYMPASVEADTWEEEEAAHADIALLWGQYCARGRSAAPAIMTAHFTHIIRGDVYGHPTVHCGPGCAGAPARCYAQVSGDDIRLGSVYELDANGRIVEEILD